LVNAVFDYVLHKGL